MEDDLYRSLGFVNRYPEVFDVLCVNLDNQDTLLAGDITKMYTPLAAQPPGTGKTTLGRHITHVLRRPREASAAQEADVARRLLGAWTMQDLPATPLLAAAQADPRNENLVMRLLMQRYPRHVGMLLALKESTPILVQMKDLPDPGTFNTFNDALGFLIFCSAKGRKSAREYVAYVESAEEVRGAVGVVQALIRENGPLLLVLDDITDLQRGVYASYFSNSNKSTALHRAMSEFSLTLQQLHAIKGCFIMCTGRSLWLSSLALVGATSPLFVAPVMLSSLTVADVLETLRITPAWPNRSLAESVGVSAGMLSYLAEQTVRVTGGSGRVVQYLLRHLQGELAKPGRALADSPDAVDAMLEAARLRLVPQDSLFLRATYDGPAAAAAAGEIPSALGNQASVAMLVRLVAYSLLMDATFQPGMEVVLGDARVKFSDAVVLLGLSYAPAAAPSDAAGPATDGASSAASSPACLRVVAGAWLCQSLQQEPRILVDARSLASVSLLNTMREFGGTMRGRPFEMLCVDALIARSRLRPDQPVKQLLPHLSSCAAGDVLLPALDCVALPKVTSSETLLGDGQRASLLQQRKRWAGGLTISKDDLPWLLFSWLPCGAAGVPADGLSHSQDFFVRLDDSNVIGVAVKAAGKRNGTSWADLRDELSKVPDLSVAPELAAPACYTLVLWSLSLASELDQAVSGTAACVFGSGSWYRGAGGRLQTAAPAADDKGAAAAAVFTVPAHVQLVVANPAMAASGSGLVELLGSRAWEDLRRIMAGGAGQVDVPSLAAWAK